MTKQREYRIKNMEINCPYCNGELIVTHNKPVVELFTCHWCNSDFVVNRQGLISKLDWILEAKRVQDLHKLPSEQQEAVKKAIEKLEKMGELSIEEPCDCGSHIRHNNGGNYHTWYDITIDNGDYYIKEGCTSELEPPYTWKLSTREGVYSLIQNCADWL
jgi:transposase-like protein